MNAVFSSQTRKPTGIGRVFSSAFWQATLTLLKQGISSIGSRGFPRHNGGTAAVSHGADTSGNKLVVGNRQ